MSYLGNQPATGENNSFKILDDISSYTLTFDGSLASVVSTANGTITESNHRFITAQRVTYSTTGTAIGGLTSGTAYYIIKNDQNTIKLATSAANANNGTAITLTALGTGTNHTLNVAFDGVNTKFKATYDNGTKAQMTRAAQLTLSVNGVIQQPQDTTTPTNGFGIDLDSVIVFSAAPVNTDAFWGNLLANNFPTFDISDNTVDSFTGNGIQVNFTLSKTPANNQNVLVTLDGVVQYPSDSTTTRAYRVSENVLTFVSAPGNNVAIQVRHIGFAGATSSSVTGFNGRTGNVGLRTGDPLVGVGIQSGGTVVGTGITQLNFIGLGNTVVIVGDRADISISGPGYANTAGIATVAQGLTGTPNITVGIITATSFSGDGSSLTGVSGFATVLSSNTTSPLNLIFKTPEVLLIGGGTSVSVTSDAASGNIAFTRCGTISVASGATFVVSSGTTFITNVLRVFL